MRESGDAADRGLARAPRIRAPHAHPRDLRAGHDRAGLGRGDRPQARHELQQAAAARARVHPHLPRPQGRIRRRQPAADRRHRARRQHVHAGILPGAQGCDRRSLLHQGRGPRARAIAVDAEHALHGGRRGRHRGRRRDPLGLPAGRRGAGARAREHPQGRHRRAPGRERLLRRDGERTAGGRRSRDGRAGRLHRRLQGTRGEGARPDRARQGRHRGSGPGIRAHDRLRQGRGRRRRRGAVGGDVRGRDRRADAAFWSGSTSSRSGSPWCPWCPRWSPWCGCSGSSCCWATASIRSGSWCRSSSSRSAPATACRRSAP